MASTVPVPLAWLQEATASASGSVTKGNAYPWFLENKQRIIEAEGGHILLVEFLVGQAVLLALGDSSLSPSAAAFHAVADWKKEIRAQYDHRSNTVSLDAMVDAMDWTDGSFDGQADTTARSVVEARVGLVHEDTYFEEEEDDGGLADRIDTAMGVLTDGQRTALNMYASGLGYQEIADTMGLRNRTQAYHLVRRARLTVKGLVTA